MATQHSFPFPTSDCKSVESFELVHMDIWGPYNKITHDIKSFFFIIVDDFSRNTWTSLKS